jgi:peptidyl-prolyl cis-trans isomerase SurA
MVRRSTFGYAFGAAVRFATVLSVLLAALTAVWLSAPAAAQGISIAVTVNDFPITNYQIQRRADLLRTFNSSPAYANNPSAATSDARDDLISERLLQEEAQRLGVSVSSAQIDSAYQQLINNIIGGANQSNPGAPPLTADGLRQLLAELGIDILQLRDLAHGLLLQQLVTQARTVATFRMTENDVAEAIAALGSPVVTEEYYLEQVILTLPSNASSSLVAQRRQQALNLRSQFTSCESGRQQVIAMGEAFIQAIGWRLSTELQESTVETLRATPNGRLTPPQQTSEGWEMLAVCDRRALSTDDALRASLREQLFAEQYAQHEQTLLRELRQRATIVFL